MKTMPPRSPRRRLVRSLVRASLLAAWLGALSFTGALAQGAPSADTVYTRAWITSTFAEADGRLYVRLKLLPTSKIPFATQTFRVLDRALLDGLGEGAWVRFTSRRVDGENVVTEIHAAEACKRFQPCD